MIILAVETSCDDTCIAIVKAAGKKRVNFKVLANIICSQAAVHRKWGGVYPTEARRAHQKNLVPALKKALKQEDANEKFKRPEIDFEKIERIEEDRILHY